MGQVKRNASPRTKPGADPLASAMSFSLDDHIPYLINRVAAIGVRSFSQELARANMTVPMWRVIAVLWSKGEQRQIDLAELTAIEASTLSRLIGALCHEKLVLRERSKLSTREVTISITDRGKALVEEYIPIAMELEQAELQGLSEDQKRNLKEILNVMYNNISSSLS